MPAPIAPVSAKDPAIRQLSLVHPETPHPQTPHAERRTGIDRRELAAALADLEAAERGETPAADTGLERRRGAGRRLSDALRSAEDGSMTKEQFLFVKAIDAFKQANRCGFPAWTDVLEVIRLLGYRKTQPSGLNLPACEDWCEKPDAAANVRPKGFERRLAA